MKVLLALSFIITIVNVTSDASVVTKEIVVDLCGTSSTSNYDNYTANNTQDCGCENSANRRPCIRKCCQKGFHLEHYEDPNDDVYESVCVKNNNSYFNVPIYNKHENVFNLTSDDTFMVGMLNCGNEIWQFFKMNKSDKKERFYIQENGSLYYPYSKYRYYNTSRYCVDEQDGLSVFLCYTPQNPSILSGYTARMINALGMIISMPFLLLTFLVFAVTYSNTSVHRRAVMCYALSLFLAYGFLVTVQLHKGAFKFFSCQIIGYSIIYFFMASFLWMNIMCLDIWLAFGGLNKFNREPKSEKIRFIIYCIYAWGLPFAHILIIFTLNIWSNPNSKYYPGVGEIRCFLGDNLPTFIYFYGPLTVIIGLNIVLFLMTAVKLQKIKKDTGSFRRWSTKRKSFQYDKRKFNLYLKLLLAMGINWSLEIVSWAIQMRQNQRGESYSGIVYIWYISDFSNAIYGVIIFWLFVYKKAVWKTFIKRLCLMWIAVTTCSRKAYHVEEIENSTHSASFKTTSTSMDDEIFF